MSTRVISVRLSEHTIAQSAIILRAAGLQIEGMPVSTVIKNIVNGVVRQELANERIKPLDDNQLSIVLSGLGMKDEAAPPLQIALPSEKVEISLADALLSDEPEEPEDLPTESESPASLARQLHEGLSEVSDRVKPQLVIDESNIDGDEDTKAALDSFEFTPFVELEKAAPLDRLIKGFTDAIEGQEIKEDSEAAIYKRCLEVVYKANPQDKWGTEDIEREITTMFQDYL